MSIFRSSFCHWQSNEFAVNLAFRNFCTNIDLPANFLEISGSGENLADFYVGIVKSRIVLDLVSNFVYS